MRWASRLRAFPLFDALVLLASLAAGVWVALQTEGALETKLGLLPPWRAKLGLINALKSIADNPSQSRRELYAQAHQNSPLSAINRHPAVIAAWDGCERLRAAGLPFLAVAGPGIGAVAIRRPRRMTVGARPLRWGPGRTAAAISLVFLGAGLAQEFVFRHFDLHTYGFDHVRLTALWENVAHTTGTAIVAAWILLALLGRWKPQREWRETLGLALGALLLANWLWAAVLRPLAQFEPNGL